MDIETEIITKTTGNQNYLKMYGMDMIKRIKELRDQDLNSKMIADELRISSHTVAKICRKFGWKLRTLKFIRNIKDLVSIGAIKKRLIDKYGHLCQNEQCKWDYKKHNWYSNLKDHHIPLELHHKDGDHENRKEENLQLLCPNCHSMTINYRKRKVLL